MTDPTGATDIYSMDSDYNHQGADFIAKLTETIQLTDLNNDCLESIFEGLSLEDLFNVGCSNKWLNIIANMIFRRKYGKSVVCISGIWLTKRDDMPYVCPIKNDLVVRCLKTCLRFLRCFGQSISKLSVHFDGTTALQRAYINQYIQEFCADSLIEIEMLNSIEIPRENITTQFPNVKSVRVADRCLGEKLLRFNQWFPNLHRLNLIYNSTHGIFSVTQFPYLEHLSVQTYKDFRKDDSTLESLAALLKLNPQLQSLDIHIGSQMIYNQFLDIISSNSLITKLSMFYGTELSMSLEADDLHRLAETVPLLTALNLSHFQVSANDAISCINQFKSLQMLQFTMADNPQFEYLETRLNDEFQARIQRQDYPFCKFCTITLKR